MPARLTQDGVVERLKKLPRVINGKYDLSKVKYINAKTKLKIICPEHGVFKILTGDMFKGVGCAKCGDKASAKKRTLTRVVIIERCKKANNNYYSYDKLEYINYHTPVVITCPEHGDFKQRINEHYEGKVGCLGCRGIVYNTETFISKAKKIWGDKYDYSEVEYINSAVKIAIICKKHGMFWQIPSGHNSGKIGCASCLDNNLRTMSPLDAPTIIYYFKHIPTSTYKVGITIRSYENRYTIKERKNQKLLWVSKRYIYEDAIELEEFILEEFMEYRVFNKAYNGNGGTEFFSKDVLNKDKICK